MADSTCYPGNSTVLRAGDGITVEGNGTPDSPFVVSRYDAPEGDWQQAYWIDSTPNLLLDSVRRPSIVETRLNGAGTLTLPVWGSTYGGILTLVLNQDSTGGRTLNWVGAGVLANPAIVLSTAPNATDVVRLLWTGFSWIAIDVVKAVS